METMIMMIVYLTMFMLMFVVLLIAIACFCYIVTCFCYIVRRISRNKEISPKLEKWIYVLDWTKEDKDD